MSKPQIILNAGCAAIAMAVAYRLANRALDSVLPKKKVEEEEPADAPAMILCAMYLLQMCVNGDVDAARLLLDNGTESTRPVAPLQVRRRPPPRSGTGRRASLDYKPTPW